MRPMQDSMRRGQAIGVAAGVLALGGAAVADIICVPDDYTTIQEAIDAAVDGDEICVAPGSYHEAIDLLGKAVRLYSTDGPEMTTIHATGLGASVVKCTRGEGPLTILEGFSIARGRSLSGGGMRNVGSSPTVTNCWFINNSAQSGNQGDGGGMHNLGGSPTVTNCRFSGNVAEQRGGGMCNESSHPTVTGCTFDQNSASYAGGMMNWRGSSATVTDCVFTENFGYAGGGGMTNSHSSPTVTGCLFSNNDAGQYWGGGMFNSGMVGISPKVSHCRFVGNRAGRKGGGMYNSTVFTVVTNCDFESNGSGMTCWKGSPTVTGCRFHGNATGLVVDECPLTVTNCVFIWNTTGLLNDASNPTVTNSIFWDNGTQIRNYNSDPIVTYCDVQGGWPGTGNIDVNPLCYGDGRLRAGSPCIDAANNDAVPEELAVDFDGNPRFADDPDTDDTGSGDPPIVDMGAFEFQVLCLADVDGDGFVGFPDLLAVLTAWGNEGGPEDVDGDGIVGFLDLVKVLSDWGPCE